MIEELEIIYNTIDIYRAILIYNDNNNEKKKQLIKELEDKDYQPLIITKKEEINYNYRLFIINDINLLVDFDKNNYNLIIFIK